MAALIARVAKREGREKLDDSREGCQVLDHQSTVASRLSRREMIRRLVSGTGAGVLFARTAVAHPIHKYLADGEVLAGAADQAPHGTWTPKILTPHQNETLLALSERVVPNSSTAQVNRFIDLLLSVDTPETRQEFSESLAAFDDESTTRFGHAVKDISEAKQIELLTVFSAETLRHRETERADPDDAPPKKPSLGPPTLRDHFEKLKTWITGAYYSSEVGMRELGWTGTIFFEDFPGCQHPDGHS
jgi:hypothetical protein